MSDMQEKVARAIARAQFERMPTSEETPKFGAEAEELIAENAFAEGVDWATPRVWNEAIEAAAGYHDLEAKELRRLARSKVINRAKRAEAIKFAEEHEAYAAAIRKLRKQ